MASNSSYEPQNGSDDSVGNESQSSDGTLLGDEDIRSGQNNRQGYYGAPEYDSTGNYSTNRYQNNPDNYERFRVTGDTSSNMTTASAAPCDAAPSLYEDERNTNTRTDERGIGDGERSMRQAAGEESEGIKKNNEGTRKEKRNTNEDKPRKEKKPKKEPKDRESPENKRSTKRG